MALMLIIEGIAPFLGPKLFKQMLVQITTMTDRQLRLMGFFSMMAGLLLLHWVH